MIPKKIHQIWLGSAKPPFRIMNSWRIFNPDWEYFLWTDSNMPHLTNQKHFDDSKSFTVKADLLRYEILLKYGGCYVDVDTLCMRPIAQWLATDELALTQDLHWWTYRKQYNNTPAVSCPQHPLWTQLIHKIHGMKLDPHLHGALTTGGKPITDIVNLMQYPHQILTRELFQYNIDQPNPIESCCIHINTPFKEPSIYEPFLDALGFPK